VPREAFLDQGVWYHFFKMNVFGEDEHGPEMMCAQLSHDSVLFYSIVLRFSACFSLIFMSLV